MQAKVIAFKLPAIQEANRNNPQELVYDVWKEAGRLETDAQGGWPAGIYDLGEGRIAAMDAAGIDVQILSHTSPGPRGPLSRRSRPAWPSRLTAPSRPRSRSIPSGSSASLPCPAAHRGQRECEKRPGDHRQAHPVGLSQPDRPRSTLCPFRQWHSPADAPRRAIRSAGHRLDYEIGQIRDLSSGS